MDNPWLKLPSKPPYVLRLDEDTLHELYDTSDSRRQLRLECLPGPFMGRRDAPVVLLNLKPGFDLGDITAQGDPEYLAGAWAMLRGEVRRYPAFLFDPRFERTPGGIYYRQGMQELARELASRFSDPWLAIARGILFVQFFPYHSVEAPLKKQQLPSQRYGFQVVRESLKRGAVVGILLGEVWWNDNVRELKAKTAFVGLNKRTWSFTRMNCGSGFDVVLRAIQEADNPQS